MLEIERAKRTPGVKRCFDLDQAGSCRRLCFYSRVGEAVLFQFSDGTFVDGHDWPELNFSSGLEALHAVSSLATYAIAHVSTALTARDAVDSRWVLAFRRAPPR